LESSFPGRVFDICAHSARQQQRGYLGVVDVSAEVKGRGSILALEVDITAGLRGREG